MSARRTTSRRDLDKLKDKTVRLDQASAADALTRLLAATVANRSAAPTRSLC